MYVQTYWIAIVDDFGSFFSEKVSSIVDGLKAASLNLPPESTTAASTGSINEDSLAEFSQLSIESIKNLVDSSPTQSCSLDPIPTELLKQLLPVLVHPITEIVNKSIRSGSFPSSLKHAAVTQLLKKPGLDLDNLTSYRPVSNLTFLAKLIERAIHIQLMKHLTGNNLLPERQSAYRHYHSTATALLSIYNDLLLSADIGWSTILLLLDLCAAFDTLEHDVLLERLNNNCRVSGKALDWFVSFLSERTQSIYLGSWSSTPLPVPFGVPQGSVLGGNLFLAHVSTLPSATSVTGVTVDQLSDDTQARVSFKPTSDGSEQQSAFNSLSSWAENANTSYIRNRVKLNPPKSTIIVTNTKRHTSKQSAALPVPPPFSIGGTSVNPSTEAKNLGVIIDNQLSMASHIRQVCKTSFYHIWRIGRIRHLIDTATTKCLINAFVLSRIDKANSLYHGLPGDLLDLLQRVLNAAARLTMKSRKCERITPHLKALGFPCDSESP